MSVSKALTTALLLGLASPAVAKDMHLVLELETHVDDEVTEVVSLYASGIDPNKRSADDAYRLEINGAEVNVPQELLAQINNQRRGYSYDTLSGGIETTEPQAICMLGGPAVGEVLKSLYLTYEDHQITGSEIRPVLSEATNCLFTLDINPSEQNAYMAAVKALAQLQTLRAVNQE
ncbi:hypothetical protein ROA7450_02344 [Roseovarius albus]|uniref:Uncharacterized protein n=1 Tax=Roseovarius albus TaxID=1247867 RepID=A0A1X6ZC47_9RHOB|nr:hypothetical protein [Roseovarius albus]SLN47283.1 hypothetical protein ROA7450_02344 [Roseovarius albus]